MPKPNQWQPSCGHAGCGCPWLTVHNGVIIVESRHHGEVHRNVLAVIELLRMCAEEGAPDALSH